MAHQQGLPPPPPPPQLKPQQLPPPTTPAPPTTTTSTTTTARPHVYSKYVCGVKGTLRSGRALTTPALSLVSYVRAKYGAHRQTRQLQESYGLPVGAQKSAERLILGSDIVPIQIHNDKLGDLIQNDATNFNQVRSYRDDAPSTVVLAKSYYEAFNLTGSSSSRRRARVVGGEDGDNGEWCWQVALINSMNQYLCGAALIGTQWVLTAAHCVTK